MFGEMVFVQAQTQESLRARWSRAASLITQLSGLSLLVLLSFSRPAPPDALHIITHPVLGPPLVMPLMVTAPQETASATSRMSYAPSDSEPAQMIHVPTTVPHGILPDPGPPTAVSLHGCPTCTGTETTSALRNLIASGAPTAVVKPVTPKSVRISHMDPGSLVKRVQPVYPPIAKTTRTQGPVVLQAVISRAGTIESLHVLSGHPFLVAAALDAVRQWRYRPYLLNGTPVEVETQITVNFSLSEP